MVKRFILILILLLSPACSSNESAAPEVKDLISAPSVAEEDLMQKARNAYDRGLYSLAREFFTELRDGYPGGFYATFAELKIADCYFQVAEYAAAIVAYEEFIKFHSGHEAVAYARYQIARSHEKQYKGVGHDPTPLKSALKSYQQLIEENPGCAYSALSQRSIAGCHELLAEHEAFVAEFYWKQGLFEPSAHRFAGLFESFSETKAAKLALERIDEMFVDHEDLLTLLHKRAETKGVAIASLPKAPNVLSAGEVSLSRTRMKVRETSATPEPESEPLEIKESKPIPQRPFFLGLECETINGFSVFSARTSAAVELNIVHGSTESAHEKITALIRAADAFEETESKSFECKLDNAEITLVRNEDSNALEYGLGLRLLAHSSPHFFVLDRPYRLIVVLEPGDGQDIPAL